MKISGYYSFPANLNEFKLKVKPMFYLYFFWSGHPPLLEVVSSSQEA